MSLIMLSYSKAANGNHEMDATDGSGTVPSK